MKRSHEIAWSAVAWFAVGLFWFGVTRSYHPRAGLAGIVTASLVTAYAAAAYINHLVLIPRLYRARKRGKYTLALAAVSLVFTAIALLIIRTAYIFTLGPDLDPNGVYKHFAIDFAGMVVHLLGAWLVVWIFKRLVPT